MNRQEWLVLLITYLKRLILIVGLISSAYVGHKISGSQQLELYKHLVSISAIIFGVMGAWLSLLKIELMEGIKNASRDEDGDSHVDKAKTLIQPMTASVLIIIVSVLYFFIYTVSTKFNFSVDQVYWSRTISFTLLAFLTMWQLLALLQVMLTGVSFLINLIRENNRHKSNRKR